MKSFLLGLLIVLSIPLSAQKTIEMTEGSFAEVMAMAAKKNKPVMVDVYADWCGPCKMMEKRVFTQKKIAKFYSENFINYKLDTDTEEGSAIANSFNIESIPTFLFFDANGKLIKQTSNVMAPDQFLRLGMSALKKAQKRSKKKKKK